MPTHFRSIICPNCQFLCDGMDSRCPNCGSDLPNPGAKSYEKAARIPYNRQFFLILVGYIGLTVLANVIALGVNLAFYGFVLPLHRQTLVNTITYLVAYPVLLLVLLLIAGPRINTAMPSFRKASAYLAGFLGFLIIIAFDMTYGQIESAILQSIGHAVSTNANQSNVNAIIRNFPIEAFLVLGFIGPACEELSYRVGLFGLCSRVGKWFAYLVAAFFFAFIHFSFSGDLIVEVLSLPSYLFAGLAFGFLYDRFGLAASLCAHVLNNCFSVIANMLI